jgi:hypothetical protein
MSNNPWYTLFNSNDNNIYSYASVKDSLNNLYVAGYSDSKVINIGDKQYSRNSENDAAYIVKLDDNGSPIWFQWIDGSKKESAHSIVVDTNNNIYITGYSESQSVIIKNSEFVRTNRSLAGYVLKMDQNGNVVWLNWLDGANSEMGYSITIDKSNNLYVIGVSNSTSIVGATPSQPISGAAGFLIKMSTVGSIIWSKWVDGINNDNIYSIVLDSESNIYIAGNSKSMNIKINDVIISRLNETLSVYLIKLDKDGTYIWGTWIIGDNETKAIDLTCDDYNFIYLTGKSNSKVITINSDGYSRTNNEELETPFVFKMNTDIEHNVEWFKWIQGDMRVDMNSLTTDSKNNLYITGSTNSAYLTIDDDAYENMSSNINGFLIKINPFGVIDWTRWLFSKDAVDNYKNYFPNFYISNVLIDRNYNLYMTGYTNAKDIEFNDKTILTKKNTSYNTYVFKYNLNHVTLSKCLKSCKKVLNKKYFIYKSLFYSILFLVFIYSIWLLYKNNVM